MKISASGSREIIARDMRLPPVASASRRALAAALIAAGTSQLPKRSAFATTADRVDPETGKLVLNNPPTIDIKETPPKVTSRCFLDISIAGKPAGRLEVEVYGEVAPKAAENFRALCTGEKGYGYAGSSFYKIVSGVALQAGEIEGKGSIYGPTFEHDGYAIKHNMAGMISMVNSGVGGSSGKSDTRFLIQPIADAGFLDGRYEAFGRVTAGLDIVDRINEARTGGNLKKPVEKINIDAAGELQMPVAVAPPPAPADVSTSDANKGDSVESL